MRARRSPARCSGRNLSLSRRGGLEISEKIDLKILEQLILEGWEDNTVSLRGSEPPLTLSKFWGWRNVEDSWDQNLLEFVLPQSLLI